MTGKHRLDIPAIGDDDLAQLVKNILHSELSIFLSDTEMRLAQMREYVLRVQDATGVSFPETAVTGLSLAARDGGEDFTPIGALPARTIYPEDIVSRRHQITGYTRSANTPTAGSIAWTDVHIVYNGTDYVAANGSTANKYVYFIKPASGTTVTLTTSNTKPTNATLGEGGSLVFINDNGTPISVIESSLAQAVATNAVDSDAIAPNAVVSTALADNAVTNTKINAGAVTDVKIGTGAVTSVKILDGAVSDTKIGTGAVTSTKILDGAVSDTKIGTGAVTDTKIANGAVTSTKILDGAVSETKIGANAVTTAKILDGAVSGSKVVAGAITPVKITSNQHMIF